MESQESSFNGVNLGGLVRRLDRHVVNPRDERVGFGLGEIKEEDISEAKTELAGSLYEMPQGVNPFFHKVRLAALTTSNQYGTSVVKVMDNILKSEIDVSYVFVEEGVSYIMTQKPEPYQMLIFRTKEPFVLNNRKELPESKIGLFIQGGEADGNHRTLERRADYIKNDSGIWVKKDLSEILPTRWFFSQGYQSHRLQPTGTE